MIFTKHPQPLAAPIGDDVNFECNLNLGAERFSWRHRPLGSDRWLQVFHMSSNGGKTSRHVVNFDNESKAGDYRCIAFYGKNFYISFYLTSFTMFKLQLGNLILRC